MSVAHTTNCIIYCRVSSKEQVDGTSLDTQERQCREYAAKNGLTVLKVFIEEGESAKTADRTEFLKAINFCNNKKQQVDFFVVYKLDRFARNQDDHVTVRALLKRGKTELRSVTEPINESPVGRAMEGMISVFAEFDNNVRTERTKSGMVERVREGYWVWVSPLGYHKPVKGKKTNIVPDPVKAPLIRAGFQEYAKGGRTYRAIAAFWTRQGLFSRRGKPIKEQEVQKMLRNPIYCGTMRTRWGEWPGGFEPIITRQLFLSCQGKPGERSSWSVPRKSDNATFPLRKLVICSECSKPLTGSATRGSQGKRYPYYHHATKGCSKPKSIAKAKFETAFVEHLTTIEPDKKYEKLFKAVVADIWKTNHKHLDEQKAEARLALSKLEEEKQRIFELHRAGVYTDDDFREQKKVVSKRIQDQYTLIEENRDDEFNMDEALSYCFDFVGHATKTWLELENNPEARTRFQNLIFKDRLPFDGQRFGTSALSPIFGKKTTSPDEKSLLVAPRGIEPLFAP